MAFTVEDFEDLQRLLAEHPEWRAQLRPLILGDEFLQVPERLNRIDERLERLESALSQLTEQVSELVEASGLIAARMNRAEDRLGRLDGSMLELRYGDNLGNWFRQQLVRPQRLFIDDLEKLSAARSRGEVSEEEVDRVALLDLVVSGKRRSNGHDDLLLAVEVSATVNLEDVERAHTAAETLKRAGYNAAAFVGGYSASEAAQRLARDLDVLLDLRRQSA
jgi:hypothetical protein